MVGDLRATLLGAAAEGLSGYAVSPKASRKAVQDAVVRYAEAQHGQRLRPGQWPAEWAIRPAPYDGRAALRAAEAEGRLTAWLAELPPPDPAAGSGSPDQSRQAPLVRRWRPCASDLRRRMPV